MSQIPEPVKQFLRDLTKLLKDTRDDLIGPPPPPPPPTVASPRAGLVPPGGGGLPGGFGGPPGGSLPGQDDPSAPPRPRPRSRRRDPIMLDLDGDGVETTRVNGWAYFDHDGNGFAESTGWVGKDDGLLVRDLNGNGRIDSGAELFGDNTTLTNGQKAANGFEALRELDGNADGKLDANDAAFASLKLWKDSNGDGYQIADELFTLEQAGVQSINVGYANSTLTDARQTVARMKPLAAKCGACVVGDNFPHCAALHTGYLLISTLGKWWPGNKSGRQSSRVQFLAQHLSQRIHRHRRVAGFKRGAQRLVNQRLITFTRLFCTLPKSRQHRIIQINCDAGFTTWCNHRAAFGIGQIVFSLHNISFHKRWPGGQKSDGWRNLAQSSTRLQHVQAHLFPPLQGAAPQVHPYLPASVRMDHKTPAQPRQKKPHACAGWRRLFSGRIQRSCSDDTYKVCIHQAKNSANDSEWRKRA